ncbi:S9 family peptidase [Deinococcus sp. AJ005]|uniref:alpha/beta hydrolase family protein n=1 Tax=Deinococcus sp. AJ005 TaxID=2652443 RepID=UPI0018656F37|nr:hypothetical protein [Deinococcus sp. AJ005]
MPRTLLLTFSLLTLTACAPSLTATPPNAATLALKEQIQRTSLTFPATDIQLSSGLDGGLLLSGRLEGRYFSANFPPDWNHEAVLYAHGYRLPDDKQDTAASDLIQGDDTRGVLPNAYRQGFAVARSVYDKRGFAVQSGIVNTLRLKRFMDMLGSTRDYITGSSLGGSVVMGLIEKYPDAFAGAISGCGAVSDWQFEVKYLTDLRALYNYFTQGTPYALPGTQDVTQGPLKVDPRELLKPVGQLFLRAKLNPGGREARLIDTIASAVPDVKVMPDIPTFFASLGAQLFGLNDITATAGGIFASNADTVYHSPLLTAQENAALNAGIQRYRASSPQAVVYAQDWYSATGRFKTKLLTYHNTADPLVPFEHEARLRARVEAAGNTANLVQQTVEPRLQTLTRVLLYRVQGIEHCGFSSEQTAFAFAELRRWVEDGVRPQDGLDITRPPQEKPTP